MSSIFPELITSLPEAELGIPGLNIYISHSDNHEVWFLETLEEIDYPEHSHCAQWSNVISGTISVTIAGVTKKYGKGESYFLPDGVEHAVRMSANYAEILYLDDSNLLGR
jgi:mannose-6-phosphate isomerase-like protein (cupin superfamily)